MVDRSKPFPVGPAGSPAGGSPVRFQPTGKPYARRKFRDWEVIACLIFQGVEVRCYRTGERITMENVHRLEKEHLVELGLVEEGKRHLFDAPGNCRYSLDTAHAIVTNGTPATSAGSSKHRIAKAKRNAAEVRLHRAVLAGEAERTASRMKSGGLKRHPTLRRTMSGKVVPR